MANNMTGCYEMSDEEALVKLLPLPTGQRLKKILGSSLLAVQAYKEENLNSFRHPEYPRGKAFGDFTRDWLISRRLPWNQENLDNAARDYMELYG